MKTITIYALGALVSMSAPCFAQENGLTKQYSDCMEKSGGVTVDMLDCIGEEYRRQDARLNAFYKAASAKLAPARRKPLLDAQRAWIQYRDLNCKFYADPDGGTLATVEANACMLTMTAARAQELSQIDGSL
jgi:uncharacterized protein YecT (DUF1311 family)